jgi:hypothetical protein
MIPAHDAKTTPLRGAAHPDDGTATDAWLATRPCVPFSDAMTTIAHACDQALADARLTTTRELDGPLHSLVTDLRREKAAALACRAIFESNLAAAVAEMRGLSQATDDAYMRKIADALETDAYQELAP